MAPTNNQQEIRLEAPIPFGCNFPEIINRPNFDLIFCILYFIICTIFFCTAYFYGGNVLNKLRNGHEQNRFSAQEEHGDKPILQRMLSR
jgi:hypothetical protein